MFALSVMFIPWAHAGKSSDRTANFYKFQQSEFEDKVIRLDVTHLRPFNPPRGPEDLQLLLAYTFDTRNNTPGGWMLVAASPDQVPALLKKYGHAMEHGVRPLVRGRVETKDMRGKLVSPGEGVYLLDLSGKAKESITKEMLPGIIREQQAFERTPPAARK